MKRSIISNSITGIALAGIVALVATRLPAANDAAIILPGTAGTTLAQEQKALRDARRQSVEAADRSVRLERQAGMARDEAEQAGRRAAAMAARIQQAEADVQAVADIVARWKGTVERVEVLPFHNMGEDKWNRIGMDYELKGVTPPPPESVEHVREIFRSRGLNVF